MNDIEELLNKAKICNHIIVKHPVNASYFNYRWVQCKKCELSVYANTQLSDIIVAESIDFDIGEYGFLIEESMIFLYPKNSKTIKIKIEETNLVEIIKFCKKYIDNLMFL